MKNFFHLFLFAGWLAGGFLRAQSEPATPASAPLAPLKENIMLTVQAEPAPGFPLDLTLARIGPYFQADTKLPNATQPGNDQNLRVTFRANIRQADGAYEVEYALEWLTPVFSTQGAVTISRYERHSLTSTVTLKMDQPVTDKPTNVVSAANETVTLKISQPVTK